MRNKDKNLSFHQIYIFYLVSMTSNYLSWALSNLGRSCNKSLLYPLIGSPKIGVSELQILNLSDE